jgi:outer membrane protein assembly factor BamD
MKFTTIILSIAVMLIFGCSKKIETSRPAEAWLKDGLTQYAEEEYKDAAKSFENAIKEAETPEIAAKAQLYLGNSYYQMEKFEEAIPSYEEYLSIYSDSPDAPEAIYKLGMCYYNQLKPIDKDQTFTIEALKNFKLLKDKYPGYAKLYKIDSKIRKLRNMLAEKQLYVAKFYLRCNKEIAAEMELRKLLQNYNGTPAHTEASLLLSEYLIKQKGREEEAIELLQKMLTKNDSPKIKKEAKNILEKYLK